MGDIPGGIKAVILIFIVMVVGFFLFPTVNAEIQRVKAEFVGLGDLATGVYTLLPYGFIGGIFVAVIYIWYNKSSRG